MVAFSHMRSVEPFASLGTVPVTHVATMAALQALTAGTFGSAIMHGRAVAGDGAGGMFRWLAGNQTAVVTADPGKGIYIPPASDLTGASGVWVRINSGEINARWWGVVGDGTTDNSTALQRFINYCATYEQTGYIPAGEADYIVSTGLTHTTGALRLRGDPSGTQGTRLRTSANITILAVTAQATIEGIGFIGSANAAHTDQVGISMTDVNNVRTKGCIFDSLYDSVRITNVVFYSSFEDCKFFSCVKRHVKGGGSGAAGYAVQFVNCEMIPSAGETGFYLENVGSLQMTGGVYSPANLTERMFHVVSVATLAGISQFSNVVFEGSTKEAMRVEGTALLPVKFFYFDNCYFNQAGASADAITLVYTRGFYFNNCYISGTNAGLTFAGISNGTHMVNCEFQISGSVPVIRSLAAAKVYGLEVIGPDYQGSQRLIDLSASSAGDVTDVIVVGKRVGSHATPVVVLAADNAEVQFDHPTYVARGATSVADGGTIAHGLLASPSVVLATPSVAGEMVSLTKSSTNLTVAIKKHDNSAGTTQTVYWEARV